MLGRVSWSLHFDWARLNPAVSFSLCLLGRLQWKKLPCYMLSQTLGGFVGAAIVCGVHGDGIHAADNATLSVTGHLSRALPHSPDRLH
ncbi:aquaporin-3-like [Hypanus sabinus]|uniref:aquaporin-3-like n=1 Tax=Hypanus sabinus TaxID=79690 RepID=UPI0028C44752|nr:aquaporin-3-like [Hypanus sabinus]